MDVVLGIKIDPYIFIEMLARRFVNTHLSKWIHRQIEVCKPSQVHICDGSEEENTLLLNQMVTKGTLQRLNPTTFPNCYLARSSPKDVARVESRTFICSDNAGPTNNWEEPEQMKKTLATLFDGSMKGRTMYIVPFCMGPLQSPFSKLGVQITDSPYAVVNMRIMTRMGQPVLDLIQEETPFVPCLHSIGAPNDDSAWPQNDNKYICHFPETREIISFGSGYGGNALLGKKCFALRIASAMGKQEGWLAEHMLIVGVTNPEGMKKYFVAAFPSACGKTNFAMMIPKLPGWKVETVGDDIAWLHVDHEGRLRAINPEAGFFGVAPGTSEKTNPSALKTLKANTIFTNVAVDNQGNVWWEGLTPIKPTPLTDWQGKIYTEGNAAHPNARFTSPANQCPTIDPLWQDPKGVPIDGILFGGRRSTNIPLVCESFDWAHGVYMGATMGSETTAAAEGATGKLRFDPFAMLPFCGYNMGDYFQHWINTGKRLQNPPKIFSVNWFRKDESGQFMWPGFGDNIRVLEWIFDRCSSNPTKPVTQTPVGFIPGYNGIQTTGLVCDMKPLLHIDEEAWLKELEQHSLFLKTFGKTIPNELWSVHTLIQKNLSKKSA